MKPSHLFQKGKSGNPAGKPKGLRVSKKARLKFEVAEILVDIKCNPFIILARLATGAESEKVRCDAAAQLAKYVAPQMRSVEHINAPENPFKIMINMREAAPDASV